MRSISVLLQTSVLGFVLSAFACGCTGNSTSEQPLTIFETAPAAPRAKQIKLKSFIVTLEQKYRRDGLRSPVELHFREGDEGRVRVMLTYDSRTDPTTANSIAEAAVELAKRLKREDPEMVGVEVAYDREVVRRDE
ncbi:MAG: hypothetical protein H7301_08075 [Cryobacterium sp.]|nr:hypothetical protein [Oligoflexia bacterium]